MKTMIQRIVLVLRKLGILRYGVKKYTYTSGRDMPVKALLDDVFDEEKDLVTRKDFQKVIGKLKGTGNDEQEKDP